MTKPVETRLNFLVKTQDMESRDSVALFAGQRWLSLMGAILFLVSLTPCLGAEPPHPVEGQKPNENAPWSDVLLVEQPEPTISYRTGWVVYEESFTKGQFVGRGWNGSGFVSFYDGRINPSQHPMPQAFWLEIDGQLLATDWEWVGLEKKSTGPGSVEAVVTLRHNIRPVTVKVHTKLDGTAILTRWLEITNTGKRPAALAVACSWSGVLQEINRWQSHVEGTHLPLYSLGYFDSTGHGTEGDFHWHDLPVAGYHIDGRYGNDRHRHPIFILRNNATGEHFIGELAWSGGYTFGFDLHTRTADNVVLDAPASMTFRAGPDAPAPLRVIAPGETVTTPEMHLGMVFGDLDAAVQAMHTHLRRSVFMPQPRGHGGWVESGIGPEIEITPEQVNHAIDAAAAVGAEVFFIDASWYAAPKSDWWRTVGDWDVSLQRFPQGLKPFRDRAHAAGMLWGLWMDAERIGDQSRVAKEHPDWLAMNYDGERKMGGLLDLTKPEVARWMEQQIARVIEENQLEFFRFDYNTDPERGIKTIHDGFIENGYWRYYEAVYGIYDRLRARFPNVIFEKLRRWRRAHRYRHGQAIQPHLGYRLADCPALVHDHQRHDHGAAARVCGSADRRSERAHPGGFRFPIPSPPLCPSNLWVPVPVRFRAESGDGGTRQALGGSVQKLRSSVYEYGANLPPHSGGFGAGPARLGSAGTRL